MRQQRHVVLVRLAEADAWIEANPFPSNSRRYQGVAAVRK